MADPVHGTYRAVVVNTNDPLLEERVTLQIPQILGDAESNWAMPNAPTNSHPNPGDVVWVSFDGGDVSAPVYAAVGLKKLSSDVQSIIDSNTGGGATPDTNIPKPPTGLAAAGTTVTYTSEGVGSVDLALTWIAPTENNDGTTLTDLRGYVLAWSYDTTNWSGGQYVRDTAWTIHGLTPGVTIHVRILAFDSSGNASDYATADVVLPTNPGPPAGSTLAQNAQNITSVQNGLVTANGRIDGKATIYVQPTAPTGLGQKDEGDIWINTTDGNRVSKSWKWNSPSSGVGEWLDITNQQTLNTLATVNTKVTTYYGDSPTAPAGGFTNGDLKISSTNHLYRWSTDVTPAQWVDAQDQQIPQNAQNITSVQNGLVTANGRIDGKSVIYVQTGDPNTPPGTLTSKDTGDIWINTSNGQRRYSSWTGSAWTPADDDRTASTLATVNTKITTYYTTTAYPTGPSAPTGGFTTGDLWLDSKNHLYRWANGQWNDSQDQQIAANATNLSNYQQQVSGPGGLLDGKSTTFVQSTDPAQGASPAFNQYNQGDIWVNTNFSPPVIKSYQWNSPSAGVGQWIDVTNQQAKDAAASLTTKITTYYTTNTTAPTAPSGGFTVGDLWIDGNNLLNRWQPNPTTAAWVPVQDKTIAKKSTVTYSTNVPGTTANSSGDLWFQRDANGKIIGQWEGQGGTSWASRQLNYQVISSVDAGTITVGKVSANQIDATNLQISAANLTSGALPNTTTVSATNPSGSKVAIDYNGIRLYGTDGSTVKVNLDATSGSGTFTGTVSNSNTAALPVPTLSTPTLTTGTSATWASGTALYYKATFTSATGETTGSNEVTITTTAVNQNINLSWSALPAGATATKIYRGLSAGGENLLVTTVSGPTTTFVDSAKPSSSAAVPTSNTSANTNAVFKADANGLYLGNPSFWNAPFRVDMSGNTTVGNALITGSTFKTASSGQRWEISSRVANVMNGYTGVTEESSPGAMSMSADAGSMSTAMFSPQGPGNVSGVYCSSPRVLPPSGPNASVQLSAGVHQWVFDEAGNAMFDGQNMPYGAVAGGKITVTSGTTTTGALTAVSCTASFISGRSYRIFTHLNIQSTVANDNAAVKILVNGATVGVGQVPGGLPGANTSFTSELTVWYIPGSALSNVTVAAQFYRTSGTGTLSCFANAGQPAIVLVEDIGKI